LPYSYYVTPAASHHVVPQHESEVIKAALNAPLACHHQLLDRAQHSTAQDSTNSSWTVRGTGGASFVSCITRFGFGCWAPPGTGGC
jgi:hypothetical protein